MTIPLATCTAGETPGIEKNALHRLRQINHEDGVLVTSIGLHGDRVFAMPIFVNGRDHLLDDMTHNKQKWRKNLHFWTWLSHGGDAQSWRTPGRDSLQVTVHHFGKPGYFYEIDIDYCAPNGIHNVVMSVCHVIVDVAWHKVTGSFTNQARIERGLGKIDMMAIQKEKP